MTRKETLETFDQTATFNNSKMFLHLGTPASRATNWNSNKHIELQFPFNSSALPETLRWYHLFRWSTTPMWNLIIDGTSPDPNLTPPEFELTEWVQSWDTGNCVLFQVSISSRPAEEMNRSDRAGCCRQVRRPRGKPFVVSFWERGSDAKPDVYVLDMRCISTPFNAVSFVLNFYDSGDRNLIPSKKFLNRSGKSSTLPPRDSSSLQNVWKVYFPLACVCLQSCRALLKALRQAINQTLFPAVIPGENNRQWQIFQSIFSPHTCERNHHSSFSPEQSRYAILLTFHIELEVRIHFLSKEQ